MNEKEFDEMREKVINKWPNVSPERADAITEFTLLRLLELETRLARQVDRAEAAESQCAELLHACIYALTAAEEQIDRCTVYWGEVAEYLRGVIIKAGGKINEPT